jgi:hypothetical protein
MTNPPVGEANQGALTGAIVGAIGGLFAIGIAPAVYHRSIAALFGTPILGLLCWMVSGAAGWLLGGQIGPRLALRSRSRRAEVLGGVLGGLVPVIVIGLWGWYMVMPR